MWRYIIHVSDIFIEALISMAWPGNTQAHGTSLLLHVRRRTRSTRSWSSISSLETDQKMFFFAFLDELGHLDHQTSTRASSSRRTMRCFSPAPGRGLSLDRTDDITFSVGKIPGLRKVFLIPSQASISTEKSKRIISYSRVPRAKNELPERNTELSRCEKVSVDILVILNFNDMSGDYYKHASENA